MYIKKTSPSDNQVENARSNRLWHSTSADRWFIHRRLQQLEISCQCSSNQPLVVEINSPVAVAQLWSVLRQLTGSRQELIAWLETCWHQ